MAEHNTLTGIQLHEPKGLAALTVPADVGKVYEADGAGSGNWVLPTDALTYGGIYSIHSDAISIGTVGTTAKKFAAFSHDYPANGTTPSFSTDDITVDVTGDYFILITITFATTSVGDAGTYQFHVRINGVEAPIGFHRTMSGSADTGSGAAQGILALTAADVLTVWVESDEVANTDDIDINMVQFTTMLVRAT